MTSLLSYFEKVCVRLTDGTKIVATLNKTDNVGVKITEDNGTEVVIPWTSIFKIDKR